jgi:hypothetical protein
MVVEVVRTALQACEGAEFFVRGGTCESCGGTLSGYDSRKKRFVVLREDESVQVVGVVLHRVYCRACGRVRAPEEPFYPTTRVGSPVVDLCRALAMTMPAGQVATRLAAMGIEIDRGSVRAYCRSPSPAPPTIPAFGITIPVSIISLSSLAGNLADGGRIPGDDVLAACNHPSRKIPPW